MNTGTKKAIAGWGTAALVLTLFIFGGGALIDNGKADAQCYNSISAVATWERARPVVARIMADGKLTNRECNEMNKAFQEAREYASLEEARRNLNGTN